MDKQTMQSHRPWVILKSQEAFVAEPWIRVSLQQLSLPDGKVVDDYCQVTLPEYTVSFAQTTTGQVVVERVYKHGVGDFTLVLPAGILKDGEEPLLGAKRELLEETGFASDDWSLLGSFVVNGNYGCGRAHLFIARDARKIATANSGDLEDIEVLQMTKEELVDAVRRREFVLLGSVAAIALSLNPIFAPRSHAGQEF
jgi:ADP-ribose pyrophosphatase